MQDFLAFKVEEADLKQTKFRVTYTRGKETGLDYEMLPGSKPKTFGCFVAVWEGVGVAPKPPLDRRPFDEDMEKGSLVFTSDKFQSDKTYTVGLAVGPELTSVCAASTFETKKDAIQDPPQTIILPKLEIMQLRPDYAIVRYTMPAGVTPQPSGHYVGLWEGESARYDGQYRLTREYITGTNREGTVVVRWRYQRDDRYTLAYFTQNDPTTSAMACWLTFET